MRDKLYKELRNGVMDGLYANMDIRYDDLYPFRSFEEMLGNTISTNYKFGDLIAAVEEEVEIVIIGQVSSAAWEFTTCETYALGVWKRKLGKLGIV